MSGKDTETEGAPTLFPEWESQSIIGQIPLELQNCEHIDTTYFVTSKDKEYLPLKSLLTNTLKKLPLNNEIGKTIFLGDQAKEALADIISVLQGQRAWQDIDWVFKRTSRELYKNEVYTRHSIPHAVCYNIDLDYRENSKENPHNVIIERILVDNQAGKLSVKQDGKFILKDNEIEVNASGASLNVHNEQSNNLEIQ